MSDEAPVPARRELQPVGGKRGQAVAQQVRRWRPPRLANLRPPRGRGQAARNRATGSNTEHQRALKLLVKGQLAEKPQV